MMRRRFILMILITMLGGCSTTVIPPKHPRDPVAVYVTDYGRHSSILLPDPQGHTVEFAFGDWDWFALSKKSGTDAIRALFFSDASALGRRQLHLASGAPPEYVAWAVGAEKVERIDVAEEQSNALMARLNALHDAHIDTVTYNASAHLWFVKYRGGYSLVHNCNHVTAEWLGELGCQTRGMSLLSKFDVQAPLTRP